MEFRLLEKQEGRKPGEVRIVLVRADDREGRSPEEESLLKELSEKKVFEAEANQVYASTLFSHGNQQKIIFAGLGEGLLTDLSTVVGLAVKEARKQRVEQIEIDVPSYFNHKRGLFCIAEAVVLADYRFVRYKTEKKKPEVYLSVVKLLLDSLPLGAAQTVQEAVVLAEQINLARDLVNEPANRQSPEDLASLARSLEKEYEAIEVEVFSERKIESMRMGAFLAVAQSAKNPPRFIVIRYFGDPSSESFSLGIAGKGIVYDTGGLSLKPSEHMVTMKTDMAGAAATLAAMEGLARNRVRVNVVGVIAACENAIGGGNYRPGDIITSMSGKTIYVANTDAEGRLSLADAVTYLQRMEKPERMVDIATLTGAAEVALGNQVIAAVSNDDHLYETLQQVLEGSTERIWRLPAWDLYKELNQATDADISNSGGRLAGAITAALFVGAFVQELPWLHLDIAGPAYTEKPTGIEVKGATGSGVRSLYLLARAYAR